MSINTTYLITGANRGIGLALSQSLLRRPRTTVIACAREQVSTLRAKLLANEHHPTSILETIKLESTSDQDFADLKKNLIQDGVPRRVDIVIANAGSSSKYASVLDTPLEAMRSDFEINTLGALKLFQACYEHLHTAPQGKFILITSILGSIGAQSELAGPVLAYGTSKVAANYLIRKIHFECTDITSVAIHPGWAKTSMGQGFADAIGVPEPPMELDTCVQGILEQVDSATRETTSGMFIKFDGSSIPW